MKGRQITVVMFLIISLLGLYLTGCGNKTSPSERKEFSKLYAEMLIAENQYRDDTARLQQRMDSLLKGTEFTSRNDVKAWLEELTLNDPQGLQEMLDSTQKYLENVRNTKAQ